MAEIPSVRLLVGSSALGGGPDSSAHWVRATGPAAGVAEPGLPSSTDEPMYPDRLRLMATRTAKHGNAAAVSRSSTGCHDGSSSTRAPGAED